MVRVDEAHWIKAGIEMSDGMPLVSSVLTLENSDWATAVYNDDPSDFRLRVTVREGVLRLQVSADGLSWPLSRLCPFPLAEAYTSDRCVAVPSVRVCRLNTPISR
jgi:uncharacterized protein